MERKRKASLALKKAPKVEAPVSGNGFIKAYDDSGKLCAVTFRLPVAAAAGAKKVAVVGDFNNWSETKNPMKKQRNGDFLVTIELRAGREYGFKYLIDGTRWENDWKADKYVPNPHGTENSVVTV